MGLNSRDIQLRLFRVLHVSFDIGYTYMQKHPMVSGALLIFFILYIFLSYVYNLLVFLSPFLVCIAVFVRIFWSSEQNNSKCAKREEKKKEEKNVEFKCPPTNERRGVLYKCASYNATSRRRNFTRKKWDVYGGLEIKAKDLSAVFQNEFTNIGRIKSFEKEISSLEAPTTKEILISEPSTLDPVTYGAIICDGLEKKVEIMEDEKKLQEDNKKVLDLGEDDKKNRMDFEICEVERNKRLESLIARRRARKQMKLQIANGLIDMKSVIPSQIAPLFITRVNNFDSPRGFEGIKMPGSAPSALRSPFDIPYDAFEERPNLSGDGFAQEFISQRKDMSLKPKQEDIGETQQYKLTHPRCRSLEGNENHDKLEQLISKEDSESEPKAPVPPGDQGEETTQKEEEKCEIDKADIEGKEENSNVEATNSMSNHTSRQETISTTTNSTEDEVSENTKPEVPNPQEAPLNIPISNTSVTQINDSLYESLSSPLEDKKKDKEIITGGTICHAPSRSLASDLQVEVSEVGSPTLTIDESHETNTTDGDSIIYDGDIDKDIATSGSEDMWGASLHSREVRRVSDQDIFEGNNWRDIGSPFSQRNNIDEDNAADVSSMSSTCDMYDDTPTYAMGNTNNSIFSDRRDGLMRQNRAPQPSSEALQRWKRLMKMMDNHHPRQMHSKKSTELLNQSENLSKTQVIDDVKASEKDTTHNKASGEEPSASVMQQEETDEVSHNSSSSSSPRSVLSIPQKTTPNQDSLSSNSQETQLGIQESNIHSVTQEMSNGEASLDSTPSNTPSFMDDQNVESHNGHFNHCKEHTYAIEDSIQEPNVSSKINGVEVCNNEEEKELKNDQNNEEKPTPLIRQDASTEPSTQEAEIMTLEDISERSRESFDGKVPLISLILESTSKETTTLELCTNVETTDRSSDEDLEEHINLNKNEAILSSSCILEGESDKLKEMDRPKHGSEGVNLQNEPNEVVEDHTGKEKMDKVDISNDLPLPIDKEVINSKDTNGEYDKVNKNEVNDQELDKTEVIDQELDKNEVIDQELDKNETLDLSRSSEEIDKISNIEHTRDHEERPSS